MTEGISFRDARADDEDFLLRLYASTRPDIALFGWDAAAQQAFLKMQFDLQARSYAMEFPEAMHNIVLVGDERAGRVIVIASDERIELIDIAISPEFRGRGIGTAVILGLQEQAAGGDLPLGLTVDKGNSRAFELYRKLGFEVTGENEMTIWMAWTSQPPGS